MKCTCDTPNYDRVYARYGGRTLVQRTCQTCGGAESEFEQDAETEDTASDTGE